MKNWQFLNVKFAEMLLKCCARAGELFCCGAPMQKFPENSVDTSGEKHLPVAEKSTRGTKISVGSAAHPMDENHFIEWIEITDEFGKISKKFLQPGDAPTAEFCAAKILSARAFCNLHGIWKIENF